MRDFELPGRSTAYGQHGMAATSHPMATLTALDVLRAGGNAVDAAVAAVAVQCVVEPGMTGIGGDCFVLLAPAGGGVVALNGSGRAPAAATPERLAGLGVRQLEGTVHAVTVPGAIDAWARLLERHGTRELGALLQPAIRCADEGFVVTPRVAFDWAKLTEKLSFHAGARQHLLPNGCPPKVGEKVRFPELGKTLRAIADKGRDAFYTGEIAADMVAELRELGGLHTIEDFANQTSSYVEPIRVRYRGADLYELPPNNQGIVALIMLRALEQVGLAAKPDVVVVAVYTDDLRRVAPSYAGMGFPLPKFVLDEGRLETVPYPEPRWWERLRLFQGFRYASLRYVGSAFALNAAILDRFSSLSREHGFALIVAYLPSPDDRWDDRTRRDFLAAWCASSGVAFLDLSEAMARAGREAAYIPQNTHWSPEGHAIAGRELAGAVRGALRTGSGEAGMRR